jgi:hypothetical protein
MRLAFAIIAQCFCSFAFFQSPVYWRWRARQVRYAHSSPPMKAHAISMR